jgi:hypothetical protein
VSGLAFESGSIHTRQAQENIVFRKLRNLGTSSSAMLLKAGIDSVERLRSVGAVAAYVAVKNSGASPSLNLLWAIEGALTGRDWKEVSRTDRLSLLMQLEDYEEERVDRSYFLKRLSKTLYPDLRREGFVGSGATLRRRNGAVIHVFNFQGSKWGHECYLNLGSHLTFLPPEGGLSVPLESLDEADCAFRDRVIPPTGKSSGWRYGDSVEDAENTIELIRKAWTIQGHAFFSKYASYPDSFVHLVTETNPALVNARENLHLARIATQLGRHQEAMAFARTGISSAHERATLLLRDLREVVEKLGAI